MAQLFLVFIYLSSAIAVLATLTNEQRDCGWSLI